MMKVFCNKSIRPAGEKLIKRAGIEIKLGKPGNELTDEELIEGCADCDALILRGDRKINSAFLKACHHLKIISLHSVGFDNIDKDEATRLGIPVGHTPGVVSRTTADMAFLLMLAASRKAFFLSRQIAEDNWKGSLASAGLGIELREKTLGIFGLGKVGFEMAGLCKRAFSMNIIYHNRHQNDLAEKELNARWVNFDNLIIQSDVISVHTNLTPETAGVFNKEVFSKMKPGALFVNTARGAIHNEKDLIEALKNKLIWGAGLDVTDPEPMAPDNPLLSMPNVVVTPHIGTATIEAKDAKSVAAAQNVVAALRGERIPYPVNPEVYGDKAL